MRDYKIFIEGEWVSSSSGNIVDDVNPANGEVFARVHWASAEDAAHALGAAEKASIDWGKSLAFEREAILLRAADIVEREMSVYVDILIGEGGSTYGKAMFEAGAIVNLLRSAAGLCRRIFGETMPSDSPGLFSMSVRKPLGIIVAIAPFNFPFLLAMKKVANSLASGNVCILKPAEETPISGLMIAELFKKSGLPKGVLNVLPGPGPELGDALISDPRVKMVSFTGSTRVGMHIAMECAKNLKKVSLELGGKSPLIILEDADIDYAVDAACFGSFIHQGQVCMLNSKIILHEAIYEEFSLKFVNKVKNLKVGNPRDVDTVIGPLIRRHQCEIVDGHITEAVEKGASLLIGGNYEGNFFNPTVLGEVTSDMVVYRDESFGPLVSLIRVPGHEEALRVANDTQYGLSAAVITNDLQKSMYLADNLEAGMVHINDSTCYDEPNVPFGGIKESGFGREGGHYSMEEMTEVKWITVQKGKRKFPF